MSSSISRTSGIYKITCTPTGKIYVGSAIDLHERKTAHFCDLRAQRHCNVYLQNAWNKHGESAFIFVIIELVLLPFLIEREQYWIDRLQVCNPRKGFNLMPTAGSPLGYTYSEETRKKISAAHRGKPKSDEHRRKLSEANKGKKLSIEIRQKLSEAHRGKPHSETHRANLSDANSKYWIVTDPQGQRLQVKGLKQFCIEHNLSYGSMQKVAYGQREHYKGWRIEQ